MLIECGHITNSIRYHPVVNVKFYHYGWKTISVFHDNELIKKFSNNGQELFFDMESDVNNNIVFRANNQPFKKDRHLFKITLDVETDSTNTKCYETQEGMICD